MLVGDFVAFAGIIAVASLALTLAFIGQGGKSKSFNFFFLFMVLFGGCIMFGLPAIAGLDSIQPTGETCVQCYTGYSWAGYGLVYWGILLLGLSIVALIQTIKFRNVAKLYPDLYGS
jgi:hypothetical protein